MLIALTGRARSGKDTAGQFFCSTYGFTQYAFADPIRAGLRAALGLTDWHFNEGKEIVIHEYGKSPRQLMQLFGTEFGRNLIHPDIWQIRAEAALDSTKNLVLTDCRFNNEAEWARNRGGYVIRISRNNIPRVHTHVSEQGISETLIDYEVENNGTLEELFAALDAAYTKRHWEC
jgi:hypothetical protein